MKKYAMVAGMFFKSQMVYRFDVFMGILELLGRILFAWIIWSAIFTQRELVDGFTFEAMLFYYVASSFLASLDSSGDVCSTVASWIRGGQFSKQMVLPVNPQGYFCAKTLGVAGYSAIFSVAAIALVAVISRFGMMFGGNAASMALAVVMVPLGISSMVCYYYFIGLTAFKFQDVGFFLYIQWTVRDFLTGSMVPLFLLPDGVLRMVRFLPFPHVVYTPVMLFMGRMSLAEGLTGFAVLLTWTVVLALANNFMYNKLRVKYDGVGI